MKKSIRTTYAPPTSEVLELKTQGIVCQSPAGAGVNNYNWNELVIE